MFRPIALYNSLKLLTIIALIGMCATATLGQTKCENQKKILPSNDCARCFTPIKQLSLAKLLLYSITMKEQEVKIEQFIANVSHLDSMKFMAWQPDTLNFSMAEDVKKALAKLSTLKLENNLEGGATNNHYRRMQAFEQALKESQNTLNYYCSILKTIPNQSYNNASFGSYNNSSEINQLLNQADDMMHLFLELYKNNQKNINLDCCDPNNQPLEFHIQTANKLIHLLNAFQPLLNQFILLHQESINATNWFAANYNQNTVKFANELQQLKDIKFGGLIAETLVSNSFLLKEDLYQLGKIIGENEDVQSLIKAIENNFGKDVSEAFEVVFEKFTIKDLRDNFMDFVKKNPGKLNSLKKMAATMPNASKLESVFDAMCLAENSVQLYYDILVNFAKNGGATLAQDLMLQKTQWLYYNSLTSLLNNAIAVKTCNHLLNAMNSLLINSQTICLNGPKPKNKAEALEQINNQLGTLLKDGLFENGALTYLISSVGRQRITVNIKFGDCFCGSTKDVRPIEKEHSKSMKYIEIIRTKIPNIASVKPIAPPFDSLKTFYFKKNSVYQSYDKIYMPPFRIGLEGGYRFYNPQNGPNFSDKIWQNAISDSTANNQKIGTPNFSNNGNTVTGLALDFLLKKDIGISINLQYSKTEWLLSNTIDYNAITYACPTCPPITQMVLDNVNGTLVQQEMNLAIGYFYYNTATIGPIIGLGLNGAYKQTQAPFFVSNNENKNYYVPSHTFYFGAITSLGLEWRINAKISIACLHSFRLMAALKPEQQAILRLTTRL